MHQCIPDEALLDTQVEDKPTQTPVVSSVSVEPDPLSGLDDKAAMRVWELMAHWGLA